MPDVGRFATSHVGLCNFAVAVHDELPSLLASSNVATGP